MRAITFDLWGTVLWPRDPETKVERRMELLLETVHRAGHTHDQKEIRAAWRTAMREADQLFRQSLEDRGPEARWELFERQLGVQPGAVPMDRWMDTHEQLTLQFPPALMPGVREAVEDVRERYRTAIICNTGFAPGTTLRQVLERHGLLKAFDVLVFSNEFGRLKPDPAIFHHTLEQLGVPPEESLHVGDLEELDVEGAHAAGMRAARYDYFQDRPKPLTKAEMAFKDWSEFAAKLAGLAR